MAIERLREGLVDFLITPQESNRATGWLRERLVDFLFWRKPPLTRLAQAVNRTGCSITRAAIAAKLRQLNNQHQIDQICAVWATSRDTTLARLLTGRGWVASTPLELKILTALYINNSAALDYRVPATYATLETICRNEADLELARRGVTWFEHFLDDDGAVERLLGWHVTSDLTQWDALLTVYPNGLGLLVALKPPRPELLTAIAPEYLQPLLAIAQESAEPQIAADARRVLLKLSNLETRDELCAFALDPDNKFAREIALEAAYAPQAQPDRALFYFLTKQWERYDSFDFDRRYLQFAYKGAHEKMRTRIIELARTSGRSELVSLLVGSADIEKRVRSMNAEDWQLLGSALETGERWSEAYDLIRFAPPAWSLKMLRRMYAAGWQPSSPMQQPDYDAMVSRAIAVEDEQPRLGRQPKAVAKLDTTPLKSVAITPDNQTLITTESDRIVFRSLPNGEIISVLQAELLAPDPVTNHLALPEYTKDFSVVSSVLSKDGKTLAYEGAWRLSAGKKWLGRVQLIDVTTRKITHTVTWLKGDQKELDARHQTLAFSPDGKTLACCVGQGIQFWSMDRGSNRPYLNPVKKLIDNSGYASYQKDRLRGGQLASVWFLNNHDLLIGSGSWLAVVHDDETGDFLFASPYYPQNYGRECQVATDWQNQTVIFSPADYQSHIHFWQLAKRKESGYLKAHQQGVTALGISQDGKTVASGHSSVIRLWRYDANTEQPTKFLPLRTLFRVGSIISHLCFSPDGRYLVSGGYMRLTVWSSRLLQIAHTPLERAAPNDLVYAIRAQRDPALPADERNWLSFLQWLLEWRFRYENLPGDLTELGAFLERQLRYEIELDEPEAFVGEYDVEIDE
jgi:WD40 repeat protein